MGCKGALASSAVKQLAHSFLLLVALATALTVPLQAQTIATTTTFVIALLHSLIIQDRTTSYRSQSASFSRRSTDLSLRGTAVLRAELTPSNTAGIS